jgi:hypothetical protein
MEEEGVHRHLWLQMKPRTTNFFKPCSHFVFTQEENKFFLDFVYSKTSLIFMLQHDT